MYIYIYNIYISIYMHIHVLYTFMHIPCIYTYMQICIYGYRSMVCTIMSFPIYIYSMQSMCMSFRYGIRLAHGLRPNSFSSDPIPSHPICTVLAGFQADVRFWSLLDIVFQLLYIQILDLFDACLSVVARIVMIKICIQALL